MAPLKKHFLFNYEWAEVLSEYSAEVRLEVYDAIIRYAQSGTLSELKPQAKMAFSFIKKELDNQKLSSPPSGKSHWNWKGGITDENHRQRASSEYRQWRWSVFNRDKHTCQICGKVGGTLNAHHIKPFSLYPELRYDINNGITLCKKCHIEIHKTEREWIKQN